MWGERIRLTATVSEQSRTLTWGNICFLYWDFKDKIVRQGSPGIGQVRGKSLRHGSPRREASLFNSPGASAPGVFFGL
jgi:hypothetical protein